MNMGRSLAVGERRRGGHFLSLGKGEEDVSKPVSYLCKWCGGGGGNEWVLVP